MRIISLLFILLVFSCKTTTEPVSETDKLDVWKIEKLSFKDINYIPNVYESAYIIYSTANQKITINYHLNKRAINELQKKWAPRYRGLKIAEVSIIQEAEYSRKGQKIYFSNILTDYIVEGENSEEINKKLSNLVYDSRIDESQGVIGLLLELKYPNILNDIAAIELYEDTPYKVSRNESMFIVKGHNIEMELLYKESYQWIGY